MMPSFPNLKTLLILKWTCVPFVTKTKRYYYKDTIKYYHHSSHRLCHLPLVSKNRNEYYDKHRKEQGNVACCSHTTDSQSCSRISHGP